MEEMATTNFCLKMIEEANPADPGASNNVQTGDPMVDALLIIIAAFVIIAVCVIDYILWSKFMKKE